MHKTEGLQYKIMIKIIKIKLLTIMMFICSIAVFANQSYDVEMNGLKTNDTYTLKTGISIVEQVPNSFYGSWRVTAKLSETSSPQKFKQNSVDLWNLSRENNVINLSNPFTGASASITVSYVDNNVIKFSKTGDYDNMRLTDTVELKLNGDTFSGVNRLTLETISDINNSVIKKETALYALQGEKISGTSIIGK